MFAIVVGGVVGCVVVGLFSVAAVAVGALVGGCVHVALCKCYCWDGNVGVALPVL